MELLDPKKKKAHNIRLFIGYILVGIAILIGAIILLFQALGYDLNRKTGQVIQNGLVFVSSHPVSADVVLNGESKGRTTTRLAIPAGKYTLQLKQDGYRTWSRTFNLDGGGVLQLVYPLLFPEKLVTSEVAHYTGAPSLITQSPNRGHLITFNTSFGTGFIDYDLGKNPIQPVSQKLPANLFTSPSAAGQKLSVAEWSTDNRHVMVRHTFGANYEYILIDTKEPAKSVNLNRLLVFAPKNLVLRDKKFDQYYVQPKDNSLQTFDLNSRKRVVIIKNAASFKSYGNNTIIYATLSADKKSYNVNFYDNGKYYTLNKYPSKYTYNLNLAGYSSHLYATIDSSEGYTYIYEDALDQAKNAKNKEPTPILALQQKGAVRSTFSENARFIMNQRGEHFNVYDLETTKTYSYDIKHPLSVVPAKWMDGHRIMVNSGNKVLVFDYDGINQQLLSPALASYPIVFNANYSRLFTLGNYSKDKKQLALVQTELLLK